MSQWLRVLWKRIQVQFLASMSVGSEPPITLSPGDPTLPETGKHRTQLAQDPHFVWVKYSLSSNNNALSNLVLSLKSTRHRTSLFKQLTQQSQDLLTPNLLWVIHTPIFKHQYNLLTAAHNQIQTVSSQTYSQNTQERREGIIWPKLVWDTCLIRQNHILQ